VKAMGPKLEIAITSHTTTELQAIVADYFDPHDVALVDSQQLFGGYSGSNYRITVQPNVKEGQTQPQQQQPQLYCLKITNGCTAHDSELMCRTAAVLEQSHKFHQCCFPIPLKHKPNNNNAKENDTVIAKDDVLHYVSLQERDHVPAFLLTYIQGGTQADKVIRESMRNHSPSTQLACHVMKEIGCGLGQMHAAVPIQTVQETQHVYRIRWYESDGGCCDVCDHINDVMLYKLQNNCTPSQRKDKFLQFYQTQLVALKQEMQLAATFQIPMGITHGDPFGDNILVNATTGDLIAFIDIEDICGGPLLFDLACCAIGCCFEDNDDNDTNGGTTARLNLQLLESLLQGYTSSRKLLPLENEHFVPFMKLTLLCNCSWRFVKFNSTPPPSRDGEDDDNVFPPEAQDSYLELQHRIEYLEDPLVVQEINQMMAKYA
jgi:hypothetical protein